MWPDLLSDEEYVQYDCLKWECERQCESQTEQQITKQARTTKRGFRKEKQ